MYNIDNTAGKIIDFSLYLFKKSNWNIVVFTKQCSLTKKGFQILWNYDCSQH